MGSAPSGSEVTTASALREWLGDFNGDLPVAALVEGGLSEGVGLRLGWRDEADHSRWGWGFPAPHDAAEQLVVIVTRC